ncbi:MAG: hypothetical protein RMY28_035395 [Nostoc sp. ChiSLP01]
MVNYLDLKKLIPFLCEAAPNSLKLLPWRSWRSSLTRRCALAEASRREGGSLKKLNASSYRIGISAG